MWANLYFFDNRARSCDFMTSVLFPTKEAAMTKGMTSPLYKKSILIETPITNIALRTNYPNIEVAFPKTIRYK